MLQFSYKTPNGKTYSEVITNPEHIGLVSFDSWQDKDTTARVSIVYSWASKQSQAVVVAWYDEI